MTWNARDRRQDRDGRSSTWLANASVEAVRALAASRYEATSCPRRLDRTSVALSVAFGDPGKR